MAEAIKGGAINMRSLPVSNGLAMYAIKQQLENGDVNFDQPSMLNLKGRVQWDAWNKMKGMSKQETANYFIKYAEALLTMKLCPDQDLRDQAAQEVDQVASKFEDPISKFFHFPNH